MTKYELYKSVEKKYKRNYLKSIPLIVFDRIKFSLLKQINLIKSFRNK